MTGRANLTAEERDRLAAVQSRPFRNNDARLDAMVAAVERIVAAHEAAALREAAEWAIGCEHVAAMKWCGICDQWRQALSDRADRIVGAR